jgi:hypothetical protein
MSSGFRSRLSRRIMATHETITGLEKVIASGSNGDVLGHMPDQFGALYQSAYEAGYRQGFRDGYTDGAEVRQKDNGRASISAGGRRTNAEENSGPRLLGLPCTNCGCFFYSDLSQCPRCQTPKVRRVAEP